MKICTKCGKKTPLNNKNFAWRKARNGRQARWEEVCRSCQREVWRRLSAERIQAWNNYFKGTEYERCGLCGFDIPEALNWHHDIPLGIKVRAPRDQIGTRFGKVWPNTPQGDQLMKDAKQCTRLCANCHSLVHANIYKLDTPTIRCEGQRRET